MVGTSLMTGHRVAHIARSRPLLRSDFGRGNKVNHDLLSTREKWGHTRHFVFFSFSTGLVAFRNLTLYKIYRSIVGPRPPTTTRTLQVQAPAQRRQAADSEKTAVYGQ